MLSCLPQVNKRMDPLVVKGVRENQWLRANDLQGKHDSDEAVQDLPV